MSNAHVPAVSPLLKVYLVAYNIFSALRWAYVLGLTLTHLFNLDGNADAVQTHSTSVLSRFMSSLLFLPKVLRSTPTTVESRLPPFLQPIYHSSTSTYLRVGDTNCYRPNLCGSGGCARLVGMGEESVADNCDASLQQTLLSLGYRRPIS
jgi:hypothetical protein